MQGRADQHRRHRLGPGNHDGLCAHVRQNSIIAFKWMTYVFWL